jgi:hypothetical protein
MIMKENRLINIMARKLRTALMKQIRPVLDADFEGINETSLKYLLDTKPLREVFIELHKRAGMIGYQIGVKGLLDDLVESDMLIYAEMLAGQKISWLTAETEKLILGIVRDAVKTGYASGWGRDQIARYLRVELAKQYGTISRLRSTMIAQTEINASVNYGSLQSAKQSGVAMRKTWVAGGRDSRPAHAAADGQKVGMDEAFNIGGELLMFPGDVGLGATAGNVINCRCRMVYERIV